MTETTFKTERTNGSPNSSSAKKTVLLIIVLVTLGLLSLPDDKATLKPVPAHLYLENLTWKEVNTALQSGPQRVIIPTGGTEQNGLHLTLGKHNKIVEYTAGRIALELGDTLVAPTIAYVPEGTISPPEGHMKFPGTLSVSPDTFSRLLRETAQSLKQHGFKQIIFIGDSGGNQATQQNLANELNNLWRGSGVLAIHVTNYYNPARQTQYLESLGYTPQQIGTHAGMIDTSELLACSGKAVRPHNKRIATKGSGSNGVPKLATRAYGIRLLELKIAASVDQIRAAKQ